MKQVRFGITTKLFLLVFLGFGLLTLLNLFNINREANTVTRQALFQSLTQSGIIINESIQLRFNNMTEKARNIASDPKIFPEIYAGETATLMDISNELKQTLKFDILIFTDKNGVVISRQDKSDMIGRKLKGKSYLFDSALSGRTTHGFMRQGDQLLQIVAMPVVDNVAKNIVRGSIAIAYALTPEIARQVNQLTASDIGYFAFVKDQKLGSTNPKAIMLTNPELTEALSEELRLNPVWKPLLNKKVKQQKVQLKINGERYHAVLSILSRSDEKPLGFVISMRSHTELSAPFESIKNTLVWTGLVSILLVILIAILIARGISNPILSLVNATKKIESGQPFEIENMEDRWDEIGSLYRAFKHMNNELKEKADLENFLAQMSENFEYNNNDSHLNNSTNSLSNTCYAKDHLANIENNTTLGNQTPNMSGTYYPNKNEPTDHHHVLTQNENNQTESAISSTVYPIADSVITDDASIISNKPSANDLSATQYPNNVTSSDDTLNQAHEMTEPNEVAQNNIAETTYPASTQNDIVTQPQTIETSETHFPARSTENINHANNHVVPQDNPQDRLATHYPSETEQENTSMNSTQYPGAESNNLTTPILNQNPPKTNDMQTQYPAEEASSPANTNKAPRKVDPILGKLINNRYKIIKLLGKGAMGAVYLAHDSDLSEPVALKMLLREKMIKDDIDLLKEEIKLARKISHRNILRTYDFRLWNNEQPYITMEYVHGITLDKFILNQGALDLQMGLILGKQICSAIEVAHNEGIIHRDLKPQNMIIARQGILKIMDFGLAMKIRDAKSELPDEESATKEYNQTLLYAGSPEYMSPEQFAGKPLDIRSDIYSVGIILYKIFTSEIPFSGQTYDELAKLHTEQQPPSMTQKLKEFPEELQQTIFKAIAKSRDDRFQSMNDLLSAISRFNTK
ncbi:MAG: protein kinase [Methylococcales bacterium]|jgi:HAMP domain-containing protein|nr:protein kinase [Methylococcales bacterium]